MTEAVEKTYGEELMKKRRKKALALVNLVWGWEWKDPFEKGMDDLTFDGVETTFKSMAASLGGSYTAENLANSGEFRWALTKFLQKGKGLRLKTYPDADEPYVHVKRPAFKLDK